PNTVSNRQVKSRRRCAKRATVRLRPHTLSRTTLQRNRFHLPASGRRREPHDFRTNVKRKWFATGPAGDPRSLPDYLSSFCLSPLLRDTSRREIHFRAFRKSASVTTLE